MPRTGITGDVLRRWREARGWSTAQMAGALKQACEKPLPAADMLRREVARWERGACDPADEVIYAYHRVFPGIGRVPVPPGFAVFGGPGQPDQPPGAVLAAFDDLPVPAEVDHTANAKLAAGADPARVWELREAYRARWREASDVAALLSALEPGDESTGDARAG